MIYIHVPQQKEKRASSCRLCGKLRIFHSFLREKREVRLKWTCGLRSTNRDWFWIPNLLHKESRTSTSLSVTRWPRRQAEEKCVTKLVRLMVASVNWSLVVVVKVFSFVVLFFPEAETLTITDNVISPIQRLGSFTLLLNRDEIPTATRIRWVNRSFCARYLRRIVRNSGGGGTENATSGNFNRVFKQSEFVITSRSTCCCAISGLDPVSFLKGWNW